MGDKSRIKKKPLKTKPMKAEQVPMRGYAYGGMVKRDGKCLTGKTRGRVV